MNEIRLAALVNIEALHVPMNQKTMENLPHSHYSQMCSMAIDYIQRIMDPQKNYRRAGIGTNRLTVLGYYFIMRYSHYRLHNGNCPFCS